MLDDNGERNDARDAAVTIQRRSLGLQIEYGFSSDTVCSPGGFSE